MKTNSAAKILMVDDRSENLFALEVILCDENYLCVRASSGEEALKILLREQDFAIILMDVQMPKMDGFETVELIRQNEKLKLIPIIFLTASMDSSVQIFKGYLAGAVDYMIKPFSPAILKAKVAVFVDLFKKNLELLEQAEEMKMLKKNVSIEKLLSHYTLSIIEAIHDPLFVINTEGKITDINNASLKISEAISRDNLIGTNFSDYFTDMHNAGEGCQHLFSKGILVGYPLTFINNKKTSVLFNGSVYNDDEGRVLGAVMVAREVSV
ncbi:MAG: response regulator [Burkholderiales bacterium]|nr:response regulator [Flavobacterium sp.]